VCRTLAEAHTRVLNVSQTSIYNNNYRVLLSGLPNVEEVLRSHAVDPVLRDLTACLPSVRKFVGKVSAAGLLVRKYPNIAELFLDNHTEDISDLGDLRSVAALSILWCNCTVVRCSHVISPLGPSHTILNMHQVRNLNINYLFNYCTLLNSLDISCHVTYTETFDRELPHFQNVKELRLWHNNGRFGFSSVLHQYVNLGVLHVVGIGQITGTVIMQTVTTSAFSNMTEFVVDHCGYLSIETA
jgi:hypothetical protein